MNKVNSLTSKKHSIEVSFLYLLLCELFDIFAQVTIREEGTSEANAITDRYTTFSLKVKCRTIKWNFTIR